MSKITEEMYAMIPDLLAAGKDRKQIAEQFGVTVNNLQVNCSNRSISLRSDAARGPKPKIIMDISLRLHERVVESLRKAAPGYGKPNANILIRDLLSRIADDDLYNAVLDEEAA